MVSIHKSFSAVEQDKCLKDSMKQLEELYNFNEVILRNNNLKDIYKAALVSIKKILKVDKASILLFDSDGILKFKAWIGLSKKYRDSLGDHSFWEKKSKNFLPILIPDVQKNKQLSHLSKILAREDVKAIAFFPLIVKKTLIGKFMVYYKKPHKFTPEEIDLAKVIGRHISFVINRRKTSEAFLNGIADGIIVQDTSERLIFANNAIASAAGYTHSEEMLKKPIHWSSHFDLRDEKGEKFNLDNLPGRKALKYKADAQELIRFKSLKTGESRWAIVKASLMLDEQGKVQFIISIIHDITERIELERRKDELISTASHELKTPIATLKGFTQILEKYSQDETSKYYLLKINNQVDRLSKLVDDLLDVSRIKSGKLGLQKEKFNIVGLIEEIANDTTLVSNSHKIIVKSDNYHSEVKGDKYRLGEVVNNLLSNAIKFSPHADKVIIKTHKNSKNIIVSVTDFGIGISKKNIDRIFEPFFQAGTKIRQSFSGLGLGLHISSQIIKGHKGKLWVESEKGKGSTFHFSVPKA